MEQSNNSDATHSNATHSDATHIWYRFPISVVDKKVDEAYDGRVPFDQMDQSWVDIRLDSIIGIRPYLDDDDQGEVRIFGTILLTTAGTDFAVDLMPTTVRNILNYTPTKVKADDFTKAPN